MKSRNLAAILKVLSSKKLAVFEVFAVMLIASIAEAANVSVILPLLQEIVEVEANGPILAVFRSVFRLLPGFEPLMILCILFLVLLSLKTVFSLFRLYISRKFAWRIRLDWMDRIFRKYMRCRYSFIVGNKQGDLLNNLITETSRGAVCIARMIEFAASSVLAVTLIATSIMLNWQVTLGLLAAVGLLLLATNRFSRKFAQKVGERRLALNQKVSSLAAESINAVREIKTFGLEEKFIEQNRAICEEISHIQVKFDVVRGTYLPFSEFLISVVIIGIVFVASQIMNVQLRSLIPILGVLVVIGRRLMMSISKLAGLKLDILATLPAMALSHESATLDVDEEAMNGGKPVGELSSDIVFENVDFSYDGVQKRTVLSGVNLRILYGKTTAVIGPSGIGKTTVADLIVRLYSPQNGRILINGVDLNELDLVSWRRRVGFVSQDTFLFNMSVRDNIGLGNTNASDEEIIEAARKAYAHDFILEMAQGYETEIGDRGARLSGGQRQRIAIARAFVRDPDLLILDEATNSLDAHSEELVRRALTSLPAGKTVLIITHDMSSLEKADVVYDLSGASAGLTQAQ